MRGQPSRSYLESAVAGLPATLNEKETLLMFNEYGAFSAACEWGYGQARMEAERLLERIREGKE